MATMLWTSWSNIRLGLFNDADDAMRLVEVRDWLAGQSWFDVTQYRSQPPFGAPMHWSRLVDLPIAAVIKLASCFLPVATAEQVAVVVVPLLLFSLLCLILYRMAVAVSGNWLIGIGALLMLSVSIGTLLQFYPTRIDHHGWQIMLGALGVLLMIRALQGRRYCAVLAGMAMALALAIAIEGLPLAVGIGAAFGIAYWHYGSTTGLVETGMSGEARGMLLAYLTSLTLCGAVLLVIMLGWPAMTTAWCDAWSPAYLLPMTTAVVLLAIGLRVIPQEKGAARFATLAIAGVGAALVFRFSTPLCAAGPFATLDPLVYKMWYVSVLEGLPVWKQTPDVMVVLLVPSLLGIIAVLSAIRYDDAGRRDIWIAMLIVQVVTCLVSVTVMRAMGMAHLLALPACAWLFLKLILLSRRLSTPLGRIATGALCVLATPVGLEAMCITAVPSVANSVDNKTGLQRSRCISPATLKGLAAIPRTTLFAPLDISPGLLAYTHHTIIGTGHHRTRIGMKTVISAFSSTPDEARRIIAGTPATYLAICLRDNEIAKYAKYYPNSIAAALRRHKAPLWLQPVPMRPGERIRVYHIVPLGSSVPG